ncbi:hypothetical protein [Actinophytocola sp.]|uniref:hypothetical protein n=1 Tax=Actinophytocola sp. TaxID=1872138 RepID=UPI002D6EE65D|nr:hypothetical protein [Actinophytocola sp.]HYQ69195.1 hypothetical protein [Actinophytocola sp.]
MPVRRPRDSPPPVSEVLTRRPGWPDEDLVPAARRAADIDWAWPGRQQWTEQAPSDTARAGRREHDQDAPRRVRGGPVWPGGTSAGPTRSGHDRHGSACPRRTGSRSTDPGADEPVWPTEEPPASEEEHRVALPRARQAIPPPRKSISTDMGGAAPTGRARNDAVLHALPDTQATGLRKFDLGNVPASVTPPRSWRRAAWFAVGTSAAVVLGLAFAAAELIGRPVSDNTVIDALPEYPTGPITLEKLPDNKPVTEAPLSGKPAPSSHGRSPAAGPGPASQRVPPPQDVVPVDTTAGAAPDVHTDAGPPSNTTLSGPTRTTVGPAPITPTDPQAMGDRTEAYFRLVTDNPEAAHAMTAGGMAAEGVEGIRARYGNVRRIEVQDIVIDRNLAITTSTVRIVRADGSETVEHRRLTYTWGGNPKITDDSVAQ